MRFAIMVLSGETRKASGANRFIRNALWSLEESKANVYYAFSNFPFFRTKAAKKEKQRK